MEVLTEVSTVLACRSQHLIPIFEAIGWLWAGRHIELSPGFGGHPN